MFSKGIFLAHKPHKKLSKGYVYLIRFSDTGTYKIGKARIVEERLKNFSNGSFNRKFKLIHTIYSNQYDELERYLHSMFSSKRVKGEEFHLSYEDINIIKSTSVVEYKTIKVVDNRTKEEKDKAEYDSMGEEWYRHLYECGDVGYYDWCEEFMER